MAQTGYTPILIYSSTTASQAPSASNLTNSTLGSELAINITDGKLFYKDNGGSVQVIGWKTVPTSAGGTGLTSYTAGDTLYYATGTILSKLTIGAVDYVMTSSGTAPQWSQFVKAISGGTGQTSYAVGDILYANTTTTLAKLADVATGNALISGGVGVAPSWGKIGLTTHVSGTLGVGNGGTGTATTFTSGSVVYAGASGVYSQDNSNFFYDSANVRLGLGTNSPSRRLELAGLTGGPALRLTNTNGNSGIEILPTSAKYSWLLGAQYNVDQTFEITPSTANGGTTFTTPVFTANGSTGDLGFKVGNIVQGTAAKGINFTANTPAAGKTSQLLNWYEEGTFTPTYTGSSTNPTLVYDKQNGKYTRIGNTVTVWIELSTTSVSSTGTGNMQISGLPFTSNSSRYSGNPAIGYTYGFGTNAPRGGYIFSSSTTMTLTYFDANTSQQALAISNLTNSAGSNYIILTMTYQV